MLEREALGHRGRVKDPEKDGRLKANRLKGVKKGKEEKKKEGKEDGESKQGCSEPSDEGQNWFDCEWAE